jgi:hypothetical protein
MDNLSSHKGPRCEGADRSRRRAVDVPSACSPDFNPLENAFAKLKAPLRKAAERTVEGLWAAIGRIDDAFTPTECAQFFSACGHDPDWQDSALAARCERLVDRPRGRGLRCSAIRAPRKRLPFHGINRFAGRRPTSAPQAAARAPRRQPEHRRSEAMRTAISFGANDDLWQPDPPRVVTALNTAPFPACADPRCAAAPRFCAFAMSARRAGSGLSCAGRAGPQLRFEASRFIIAEAPSPPLCRSERAATPGVAALGPASAARRAKKLRST